MCDSTYLLTSCSTGVGIHSVISNLHFSLDKCPILDYPENFRLPVKKIGVKSFLLNIKISGLAGKKQIYPWNILYPGD